MGEVVAGVVAIGAWIVETWASIAPLWQMVALGAASYVVAEVTAQDAEKLDMPSVKDRGHLLSKTSTNEPLKLIYGTTRVGINRAYMGVSGEDNKYLHIIGILGEGPIEGFVQVSGVDQLFLNDKLYTEFSGNITYQLFTGTATQTVCSTLNTAISEWTDPLRYTAYLYIRLEYDRDIFNSLPTITAIVKGLKLYDPYADTTVWSENPALCVYDMLTRPSTRGGMGLDVWGGPVPSSPRINTTAINDAKTYCTTKGWTCNMPVMQNTNIADNLELVLANFRGVLVFSENQYKLKYKDTNYESTVMNFDEDEVISVGAATTLRIAQPDIFARPNAIRAKYLSDQGSTNNVGIYQVADYVKEVPNLTEDYREKEVKLYGLNDLDKVQGMANYFLERNRWNKTFEFTAASKALAIEPMDLVQLTHSLPGWINKLGRVLAVGLNPDGSVALSLVEEQDSLYDDTYNLSAQDWHDTTLPGPNDPVGSVINVSQAEEVYYYRGRSFTRWKIDFDPPSTSDHPFWDYAEIWIKIGSAGTYKYMTKSTSDYVLDPVEEGEEYFCKMRSVNIFGAKEDFDSAYTVSKNIIGITGVPTSMTTLYAIIVNDVVNIQGVEVADTDVVGYEFRISDQTNTSWDGALYLAFNRKPVYSLSGMRKGDFRVFCSPIDNAGNSSATPKYTDFSVEVPHGYTLDVSENIDYDDAGDSFNNTEMYDRGGGDYALRVIHTGGLTGTYTSREIDRGSIAARRVQGDFITEVLNAAATWAALWPTSNIWSTQDMSKTFAELFGSGAAAKLSAKLKWGDSSGSLTNEANLFHLLATDTNGRYYQVEVTIEDANENQYLLLDGLGGGDTVLTLEFYI